MMIIVNSNVFFNSKDKSTMISYIYNEHVDHVTEVSYTVVTINIVVLRHIHNI